MAQPPVPNQEPFGGPFYVTQQDLTALEHRIMQRMQHQFQDLFTARMELVTTNHDMQLQIDRVRNAVRALEHRCEVGAALTCATAALKTRF